MTPASLKRRPWRHGACRHAPYELRGRAAGNRSRYNGCAGLLPHRAEMAQTQTRARSVFSATPDVCALLRRDRVPRQSLDNQHSVALNVPANERGTKCAGILRMRVRAFPGEENGPD